MSAQRADFCQIRGEPLAAFLWGCIFAACPEPSARLAAKQQQRAEGAVPLYQHGKLVGISPQRCRSHFPTELLEVVSGADSSKAVLSELFSFFSSCLASENNPWAFLGSCLIQSTY